MGRGVNLHKYTIELYDEHYIRNFINMIVIFFGVVWTIRPSMVEE